MIELSISNGKVALIPEQCYDSLINFKWTACCSRGKTWYAVSAPNERRHSMHRLVWNLINGPIPKGMEIDHIDGNGLNNSIENLRLVTPQQNHFNTRLKKLNNTSKFKGVSWNEQCKNWRASIIFNDKFIHIGRYKSEIEAAKAYDRKAKELFGEFARPNFKED